MTPRHDVVVVGARCAGAATAMLLARAGRDVVLVDRAAAERHELDALRWSSRPSQGTSPT
ncbi:MAG: FAD-dependent monooxygenase [Lapillicoccus sp.]